MFAVNLSKKTQWQRPISALLASVLCLSLVAGTIIALSPSVQAQVKSLLSETVRSSDGSVAGQIDWSKATIRATGRAPRQKRAESIEESQQMALVAAKVLAQRNLAETLAGVRIESKTTVRNLQLEDDTIVTEVAAIIKNARVVKETVRPDGGAEVTIELGLFGGDNSVVEAFEEKVFSETILPELATESIKTVDASVSVKGNSNTVTTIINNIPVIATPAPVDISKLRDPVVTGWPKPASGQYTSLLVDARGLVLYPCMAPKLYNENGQEVYGTVRVSPDWAIEHGIVSFPRSMEQALKVPRAGGRPLIVKALRSSGPGQTNLVISNEDAQRVLEADANSGFFKACAVIFLSEGR